MRLLLIDDVPSIRSAMRRLFRTSNVKIVAVGDANAALDILALVEAGLRFDLVLTDLMLDAGMSGVELCEKIRVLYPGMPVVAITGLPIDGAVSDLFDAVLSKPLDLEELEAIVERFRKVGE